MELIKLSEIPDKVSNLPYAWYNDTCDFADSVKAEFDDINSLSDHNKLIVVVWAYTHAEFAVFQRKLCKMFGWSRYKVRKLIREINQHSTEYFIDVVATFDESTGLLSGRGYMMEEI